MSTTLRQRAAAVLSGNDRGAYTVPSGHLYPHQWAWDSALIAIGWAHLDADRAVTELETLLAGRWADGRVPHIRFHQPGDYFPGPEFWRTGERMSSSITQPPVWATAARRVLALGGDRARIRALLPGVEQSHRFFHEQRDPLGWGAVAVVHPWESGLDNSPAWDRPMRAVDTALAPPFKRVDVDRVDDPDQRPTDREYSAYASLVAQIADDGFGPGTFAVYDPLMSCLLARGERDLAALAGELGQPARRDRAERRAARLEAGVLERLWDPALGRCRFYDARADRAHGPDVLAAYAPVMLDAAPDEVRRVLLAGVDARYRTPWPLPSTAPQDPAYDPRRYWRGPSWINTNWLLAPFVGGDVAERSLALMEREGFREYFHPETGEGLGARDFGWSAALALDWMG